MICCVYYPCMCAEVDLRENPKARRTIAWMQVNVSGVQMRVRGRATAFLILATESSICRRYDQFVQTKSSILQIKRRLNHVEPGPN